VDSAQAASKVVESVTTTTESWRTATWYHAPGLRAATLIPVTLSLGIAAACSGAPSREPVAPPRPAAAPAKPAPRPAPWSRFAEVSSWAPVNEKPFASQGHGTDRYLVDIRVSPEIRDAYLALLPSTKLPVGALVAAFHRDEISGKPGPIYVMEKTNDGWKFAVYASDGSAVQSGALGLCARCHAESRSDSLFGLPHAK
jgi:hypothetical protein